MGFSEWDDMCPHQISVEPFTGVDTYGAYTYGSSVTYKARIQGKNRLVMNLNGEEAVAHFTIYVAASTIGPKDLITLPAPFEPTVPSILDVAHVSDESGGHHTVVIA